MSAKTWREAAAMATRWSETARWSSQREHRKADENDVLRFEANMNALKKRFPAIHRAYLGDATARMLLSYAEVALHRADEATDDETTPVVRLMGDDTEPG